MHVGDVMVKRGDPSGTASTSRPGSRRSLAPEVCASQARPIAASARPCPWPRRPRPRPVKNIADPIRLFAVWASRAGWACRPIPFRCHFRTSPRSRFCRSPTWAAPSRINFRMGSRRDHHGAGPAPRLLRHRPQLGLHLQGQGRASSAGRPRPRRAVRAGGSVRRAGERVRIGVQLADAGTGTVRSGPSGTSERLADLFALQDEIAASVVVRGRAPALCCRGVRLQQKPPGRPRCLGLRSSAPSRTCGARRGERQRAALNLLPPRCGSIRPMPRALGLHAWLSLWRAHLPWSAGGLEDRPAPASRARPSRRAVDRDDPWAQASRSGLLTCSGATTRMPSRSCASSTRSRTRTSHWRHACLGLTLAYGGKGTRPWSSIVENAIAHQPTRSILLDLRRRSRLRTLYGRDYAAGLDWARRSSGRSRTFPALGGPSPSRQRPWIIGRQVREAVAAVLRFSRTIRSRGSNAPRRLYMPRIGSDTALSCDRSDCLKSDRSGCGARVEASLPHAV